MRKLKEVKPVIEEAGETEEVVQEEKPMGLMERRSE